MNKEQLIAERAVVSNNLVEIMGEIESIEVRIATLEEMPHLTRSPAMADEELLRARTKRAHLRKEELAMRAALSDINVKLLDVMLGMVDEIADRFEDILDPSAPAA